MIENKEKNLPEFDSLDELVNFFDENDFGNFDEKLKKVHQSVKVCQKFLKGNIRLTVAQMKADMKRRFFMKINSKDSLFIFPTKYQ